MEMNLVAIWHGMNNLVRAVVIVLTLQALACLYVAIDRLFLLAVSVYRGRKFARRVGPLLAAGDHDGAVDLAQKHRGSHLAGFIVTGVKTFDKQCENGQSVAKAAELASRALERKADGAFLGYCGLKVTNLPGTPVADDVEIGWRLREDAWGQGYATEAATAVLDWAWANLNAPRIVSFTIPTNLSSQRVQLRNLDSGRVVSSTTSGQTGGFTFSGLTPANYMVENSTASL